MCLPENANNTQELFNCTSLCQASATLECFAGLCPKLSLLRLIPIFM